MQHRALPGIKAESVNHLMDQLLAFIGAPDSAGELSTARAEKELRNDVNRQVNCEAANLDKAVNAAPDQRGVCAAPFQCIMTGRGPASDHSWIYFLPAR